MNELSIENNFTYINKQKIWNKYFWIKIQFVSYFSLNFFFT